MSRISKQAVNSALKQAAAHIVEAAKDDGRVSRADLKSKLQELKGTEKNLTDVFFKFIDHRDFKSGAQVTAADVKRAVAYAKEHMIDNYDLNNNGLSKDEIAKMSVTGKLAVALARELKEAGATTDSGGAGSVNRGALDRALEDLQEEWGSENIMDGMVAVQSTVVAGGSAKDTAVRDLEGLVSSGDLDGLVGARATDGPRPLKPADLAALAKAVNDDGFQYANPDEIGRIRGQIENILKKLGGPAGLEVALVKQQGKANFISDTDTFPVQLWVFRNPATEDAVNFAVRKGSL
jgi:hypothetical protein